MTAIGSVEWFDSVRGALGSIELGNETAQISYAVEKTPEGKVTWTENWVAGTLDELTTGASKQANVAFTLKWPDFLVFASAERSPSALFMQGRLKMSGDMQSLLGLLPHMDGEAYRGALAQIGSSTDR
ncbi:MAG: SCP2 sterol-binding domain-containing protein [Actinomycetia bacterium]|nr:SCP2 sterol-binding domain-containing protein [Actinomycetes bacterium]